MAYRPATSVTTSRTAPVPSFRAVTTAPGTPAFEASTTVPAIDPTDWAKTGADVSTATTRINVDTRKHGSVISHLPVMARVAQRGDEPSVKTFATHDSCSLQLFLPSE